ncbi:MAG: vanadium-dependent haloperoxidase [Deinococcota bacterium]
MKILFVSILYLTSLSFGLSQGADDSNLSFLTPVVADINPEHSIARNWNEMLLTAIRNDLARPTVHARNLFHSSLLMYDLWAVFEDTARPYLLGQTQGDFTCDFAGYQGERSDEALREAISYGMYTLLDYRFYRVFDVVLGLEIFLSNLGYDPDITTTEGKEVDPAALGNYLARCIIDYGHQDGANERNLYDNVFYEAANAGLDPLQAGNPSLSEPNRWQPLIFPEGYVDQSGNVLESSGPIGFLGAEWGYVAPFALDRSDLDVYRREGHDYPVYHDPGAPPYLGVSPEDTDAYIWNFATVAHFSADLDPASRLIDISPASLGNVNTLPQNQAEYESFYTFEGGMMGSGYDVNPVTGETYDPQLVPLGDYARVLAEYWADGPDSETPPGHWFTILNYVSDHPAFVRRWAGQGDILDPLEWDVKAYFTLGGAMHDAAVASWGIKGWYDYPRPVSVIRYLSHQGQRSDPTAANYSPHGFELQEGLVELVGEDDPLAGANGEHVGKIKLYAWRGPDYIQNPDTDTAGVGWILAENWWPYQRPNFVTPPFAGYISGHSTFSSAAADILTYLTGSPYFPGGLGEFTAEQNAFLVFEEGPSVDVVLQWASYADAADQTSLSRIWGGIHPPIDDIPGRHLGKRVARDAFELASRYFEDEKRD